MGQTLVAYLDDFLGIEESRDSCDRAISTTLRLMDNLGFTINLDKSVLTPKQSIEFLGFILDSNDMTVYLTERKRTSIIERCNALLICQSCSIRDVASLIGSLVACEPSVPMARLYYKSL